MTNTKTNTNINTPSTPTHAHMIRKPNWELELFNFFAFTREKNLHLNWKFRNCASWTCDGIKCMTGEDLYAELRDAGETPFAVYKALRELGFESVHEMVASKLEEIPRAFARYGDVCLYPLDQNALIIGASPEGLAVIGSSNAQATSFDRLGMEHAVCIAEPPFIWALMPDGLISLPITENCIFYKVGE